MFLLKTKFYSLLCTNISYLVCIMPNGQLQLYMPQVVFIKCLSYTCLLLRIGQPPLLPLTFYQPKQKMPMFHEMTLTHTITIEYNIINQYTIITMTICPINIPFTTLTNFNTH